MRIWAVLGMLLAVTLAGCAEEAPVEQGETTGLDEQLRATEDTGVIRGVVIDERIVPISGATVTIDSTGDSTTTNADGEFGFSDLPPGFYFLTVDRLGYEASKSQAQVEAGVDLPAITRIQLVADPDESPDFEVFKWEGFLQCSATLVVVAGNLCGLVEIATGEPLDEPLIDFPLKGQPDYLQSEMIWDSSQPAGDSLALMYSWDSPDCDPFLCDHEVEGESPLLLRMEGDQIEEVGFGSEYNLTVRVFNRGLEETGGSLGTTFEQRFTVFTVAFYGWTPEDSYRFEVDGEPVPPSV